MTILFTVNANCINHSLMVEYCYRGSDWCTVDYRYRISQRWLRFLFFIWKCCKVM